MHETACVQGRGPEPLPLQSGEDVVAARSVALCCILRCWRCAVGKLLGDGNRLGCCIFRSLPWNGKVCLVLYTSNLKLAVQSQVAARGGNSMLITQSLCGQGTGALVQVIAQEQGSEQGLPMLQQCPKGCRFTQFSVLALCLGRGCINTSTWIFLCWRVLLWAAR